MSSENLVSNFVVMIPLFVITILQIVFHDLPTWYCIMLLLAAHLLIICDLILLANLYRKVEQVAHHHK